MRVFLVLLVTLMFAFMVNAGSVSVYSDAACTTKTGSNSFQPGVCATSSLGGYGIITCTGATFSITKYPNADCSGTAQGPTTGTANACASILGLVYVKVDCNSAVGLAPSMITFLAVIAVYLGLRRD